MIWSKEVLAIQDLFDMETLIVLAQHRNQAYRGSKVHISDRFETSPSTGFKGINCRTFQSGAGILPSPRSVFSIRGDIKELKLTEFRSETLKPSRKTDPIAISPKPSSKFSAFCEDLSCSELWAGPAYSNSPPPSSLPIPKFSLRQKRSVSLDFPDFVSAFEPQQETKSAPASPVRDSPLLHADDLFFNPASATENLRRILNLDLVS